MKVWAAAAAILVIAGTAEAGGFAPVVGGTTVTTVPPAPARLEMVRYIGPQVGRNVVVPVNGVPVATIEWRSDVQVRVRTESGALLTPAEQDLVQAEEVRCRRGEPTVPTRTLERNGTLVIDYDCTWLQGAQ